MTAKINKSAFVAAGIYVILGIVMIAFPETTMKTFCLVLGTIGVILGMINLVSYFSRDVMDSVYKYDFAGGIIMILAGIAFIVKMDKIIELIPMILGVLIIASGLIKLQHSIDLKRIDFNGWVYVLVFSLLCLSVGAVCVLQPDFIASTLVVILGISFLFCGITDLVTLIFLSKKMKETADGTDTEASLNIVEETEKEIKKWFPFGKKDKEAKDTDEENKAGEETLSDNNTDEAEKTEEDKDNEEAGTGFYTNESEDQDAVSDQGIAADQEFSQDQIFSPYQGIAADSESGLYQEVNEDNIKIEGEYSTEDEGKEAFKDTEFKTEDQ